ncbi:MAG: DNA-binding transcriptional MerR regulator [Halioglobus sp.]|jgi:DNA-binding transcriptional MerR regulator
MAKITYNISQLAAEFDVTTRTIRFYEEKGLLSPTRSGASRVYTAADRTKLKLILRGKRLGFTLEESRDIIELYDPTSGNVEQLVKLRDRITQQRAQLDQQMLDLKAMTLDLEDSEEKCLQALADAAEEKQRRA